MHIRLSSLVEMCHTNNAWLIHCKPAAIQSDAGLEDDPFGIATQNTCMHRT